MENFIPQEIHKLNTKVINVTNLMRTLIEARENGLSMSDIADSETEHAATALIRAGYAKLEFNESKDDMRLVIDEIIGYPLYIEGNLEDFAGEVVGLNSGYKSLNEIREAGGYFLENSPAAGEPILQLLGYFGRRTDYVLGTKNVGKGKDWTIKSNRK